MKPSDFQLNATYYFLNHPGFPPAEKFTVEKVEADSILVRSSLPRFKDAPMSILNHSLRFYGTHGERYTIKFVDEALMKRAIKMADHVIENGVIGSVAMDFSDEVKEAA